MSTFTISAEHKRTGLPILAPFELALNRIPLVLGRWVGRPAVAGKIMSWTYNVPDTGRTLEDNARVVNEMATMILQQAQSAAVGTGWESVRVSNVNPSAPPSVRTPLPLRPETPLPPAAPPAASEGVSGWKIVGAALLGVGVAFVISKNI